MLKSAMKYAVIEKYGAEGEAKDEDVLAAVRKEIKKRQDSIEAFEKGGRPEQATKEKAEMKILEAYLPAAMSEADLEKLVKAVIAELGATDKKTTELSAPLSANSFPNSAGWEAAFSHHLLRQQDPVGLSGEDLLRTPRKPE
jgi:hypothetical protein